MNFHTIYLIRTVVPDRDPRQANTQPNTARPLLPHSVTQESWQARVSGDGTAPLDAGALPEELWPPGVDLHSTPVRSWLRRVRKAPRSPPAPGPARPHTPRLAATGHPVCAPPGPAWPGRTALYPHKMRAGLGALARLVGARIPGQQRLGQRRRLRPP